MARKPIDELAKSIEPTPRDKVWEILRRDGDVTIGAIFKETWLNRDTVRSYLTSLERAGIVTADRSNGQFRATRYRLLEDLGGETPRINRDGERVTQGSGTAQMWRTMKNLRDFTPFDLAALASLPASPVSEEAAKAYIYHLNRAGYLVVIHQGKPGTQHTYRLINWTGPKPPMIQRVKNVFDPNLNQVADPHLLEAIK